MRTSLSAGLLVIALLGTACTSGSSDSAGPPGRDDVCWGLLPVEAWESLLPPGEARAVAPPIKPFDMTGPLGFDCDYAGPKDRVDVVVNMGRVGVAGALSSDADHAASATRVPLNGRAVAWASSRGAAVALPACIPGAEVTTLHVRGKYYSTRTAPADAREMRARYAEFAVMLANVALDRGGCTAPRFSVPASIAGVNAVPLTGADSLCGFGSDAVPTTVAEVPASRSWTLERGAAPAPYQECALKDGDETLFRFRVLKGEWAYVLRPPSATENNGVPGWRGTATQSPDSSVDKGFSTSLYTTCRGEPMYLGLWVGISPGLPKPWALFEALADAVAARDACEPLRTSQGGTAGPMDTAAGLA